MNFEDITKEAALIYEPNSFDGAKEDPQYLEPVLELDGDAQRYDINIGNDHFYQSRDLFNLMNNDQQNQLFSNIAEAMQGVPSDIIDKQLALFEQISSKYSKGVKEALS